MSQNRCFLIVQARLEDAVKQSEFESVKEIVGLKSSQIARYDLWDKKIKSLNLSNYSGIILLGSPYNLSDRQKEGDVQRKIADEILYLMLDDIIKKDLPYFGCCYGMAALVQMIGGNISTKYAETAGETNVEIIKDDEILKGIPAFFKGLTGHHDGIESLPEKVDLLCKGDENICPFQMVKYKKNMYGSQFHVETSKKDFSVRVRTYVNHGYFDPSDMDKILGKIAKMDLTPSQNILKNFVSLY